MSLLYSGLLSTAIPESKPNWADKLFGGGLLDTDNPNTWDAAWRQPAQKSAMINAGLAMMAASAPGQQTRPTLGSAMLQGLQAGQGAYQGAYRNQLQGQLLKERAEDRKATREARELEVQRQKAVSEYLVGKRPRTAEDYLKIGQDLMAIDPARAKPYFDLYGKMTKQETGYTLSPGSKRFDAQGNVIAEVASAPQRDNSYYQAVPTADGYMRFNARTGQMEPLSVGGQAPLPISADPNNAFGMEQAKTEGKGRGTKNVNQTKVTSSLSAAESSFERVSAEIDKALREVGSLTAGPVGAVTSGIPGLPARDFRATLETVKSNIGFDALNEMRQNSPTGGALGQVTERELAFLQATLGNLDQAQTPSQLAANLQKVKSALASSRERLRQAYQMDYGTDSPSPYVAKPQSIDDLVNKYANP